MYEKKIVYLRLNRRMLEVMVGRMVIYLRGRQSVTSCRGGKSKARIDHTGVPQGSKMSPLFSFYLSDMPRPT